MDRVFPLAGPVPARDLVDRDGFAAGLAERLWAGQSVVLAGPRRIGKSSVAAETLRRLAARGATTASLNLEEASTLREFAARLAAGCLRNLSRGVRATGDAVAALAESLGGASIQALLLDIEVEALRHPAQWSTEAYLDEALSLPEAMARRTMRPVVVLLDEFQLAQTLGGEAFMRRLRSRFQRQQGASFLFVGSAARTMDSIFGRARRPFHRFAVPFDLPPVADGAWRRYLRSRYRAQGVAITADALARIVERTGGHPNDTMQLAFEALALARESGAAIDVPSVDAAYGAARADLATAFDYDLDRAGPLGRILLARVAKGQRLYQDVVSADTVRWTLVRLVRTGYLERLGHGRYALREPMLADHLR